MYWESNQQQFKFSPCSGQKEKVEKKGGGQQSTNNIGAPQFFVRRWKEESPSQYAEIVIEPNILALTKENLYQLGTYSHVSNKRLFVINVQKVETL